MDVVCRRRRSNFDMMAESVTLDERFA